MAYRKHLLESDSAIGRLLQNEEEEGDVDPIGTLTIAIHHSLICVLSIAVGPFYDKGAFSVVGQLVELVLMLCGVMFMAMPIAIVGTCFSQTWFDQDV